MVDKLDPRQASDGPRAAAQIIDSEALTALHEAVCRLFPEILVACFDVNK